MVDSLEEITTDALNRWYDEFEPIVNDPVLLHALLNPDRVWATLQNMAVAARPAARARKPIVGASDGVRDRLMTGSATVSSAEAPASIEAKKAAEVTAATVVVHFAGGMANNLLQYIAGRIMATQLGADLEFVDAAAWATWFPNMAAGPTDQRKLGNNGADELRIGNQGVGGDQVARGRQGRPIAKGVTMVVGDSDAPKRCAVNAVKGDSSSECRGFIAAMFELASSPLLPERIEMVGHFEEYDLLQVSFGLEM